MIRCGACGLMVTAEHKTNRFGSRYIYYHCTKRQLGPRCPQPSVEVRELERQIVRFLECLSMSERILKTALSEVGRLEKHGDHVEDARQQSLTKALGDVTVQLSELTNLRLRKLLTDDEFIRKRQDLQREELRLKERLETIRTAATKFEPLKDVISFQNGLSSSRYACLIGWLSELVKLPHGNFSRLPREACAVRLLG